MTLSDLVPYATAEHLAAFDGQSQHTAAARNGRIQSLIDLPGRVIHSGVVGHILQCNKHWLQVGTVMEPRPLHGRPPKIYRAWPQSQALPSGILSIDSADDLPARVVDWASGPLRPPK